MPKVTKERREFCETRLRELLQPGDRIYPTVTHVARSGMSRSIDFYIYRPYEGESNGGKNFARNPQKLWLTPFIGDLLGESWGDGGVKRSGCGMDMAFDAVYNIGRILYPKGFGCVGEGCRSNDHSNGDQSYTPHVPGVEGVSESPAPHWHTDGGYAFTTDR